MLELVTLIMVFIAVVTAIKWRDDIEYEKSRTKKEED